MYIKVQCYACSNNEGLASTLYPVCSTSLPFDSSLENLNTFTLSPLNAIILREYNY